MFFGLPRGNKSFALSVFTRGQLMSILPGRQRDWTLAWIGLECDSGDLVPPEKGEAATLANVSVSCLNDHRCVVTPTAWVTERIVKESGSGHAWQATVLCIKERHAGRHRRDRREPWSPDVAVSATIAAPATSTYPVPSVFRI